MVQESSWLLKPPCNTDELIAPESLTCWSGTQWVQDNVLNAWIARNPEWNTLITVKNDDSFHQASEVYPYHHPEVDGQCFADTKQACTVTHISNTELSYSYDAPNDEVLQFKPLSAFEIKTKIKSNQYIHQMAGLTTASFKDLDLHGDECASINQSVLNWALQSASEASIALFNNYGTKMLFADDKQSLNGGAWIIDPLGYSFDQAANTLTLTSKSLPINGNNPVVIFRDMHYCKLLSPMRAIEWIYVDSLYETRSLA